MARGRRRARAVAFVGAFAALVGMGGQGGAAVATEPPPQDLVVSFVGPDGAPVPGACVDVYRDLWGDARHVLGVDDLVGSACAGEQSSVTAPGLEGSALRLLVHAPEPFADAWVPGDVGVEQPVVVRLALAGSMSGEVMLADGTTPAEGATVLATRLGVPASAVVPLSATVSRRGSYEIRGVAAGRYSLVVRFKDKQQVVNGAASRHPAEVMVRARLDAIVPFVTFGPLATPAPTAVRVQVVDVWTRAAVPGVCVVPVVGGRPDASSALPPAKCAGGAVSNGDGVVQLQVAGQGTVPLAAWGRDGTYVAGDGEVTLAPGGTATATVEVVPYAGVRGRVVDAITGKPIAGVCPRLEDDGTAVAAERVTCSDAKGWWEVAAFPAGTAVVVLEGGAQHGTRYVPGVATAAKAQRVTLEPGLTTVRRTVLPPS